MSIRQIKTEFRDTTISLSVQIVLLGAVSVIPALAGDGHSAMVPLVLGVVAWAIFFAFVGIIRLGRLFSAACNLYIQAERRAQAFGAEPKENLEELDRG